MRKDFYRVLHICDYAASYRGNFIDSLESLETYHDNVKNYYLFPVRAADTNAKEWIAEMNQNEQVSYIQEKSLFKMLLQLVGILREKKINRIVRHFSDTRVDIILKFIFKSKHIIRFFHCGYEPKDGILKHYLRRLFWKNNHLVGVSDSIAKDVKKVLPGFCVTAIVNAVCFERLDVLDDFEPSKGTRLLMMGWDYERKGVDLAVKAINNLKDRYDLTLQIVGGKNEDKIRELVQEILGQIPDWIRFLPPTNNIGTYYTENDIFLSPSRQEAFGYASVEASYCRNSLVLTKVDGQGEMRMEGIYWVRSEDVKGLTEQIEKAIQERNIPEKVRQRESVRAEVEKMYSLEGWTNKVVALFKKSEE